MGSNILFFISIILMLSACGGSSYIGDCDSGFTTGESQYVSIRDGAITWASNAGKFNHRKMLQGETCIVTKLEG